jgi:hypothetical protein
MTMDWIVNRILTLKDFESIIFEPGWGATWKKEGDKWQGHMVGGVIIPSRHPRRINSPWHTP